MRLIIMRPCFGPEELVVLHEIGCEGAPKRVALVLFYEGSEFKSFLEEIYIAD
jgi:hypothetical protein